jgi:hypothetical protein
MDSITEALVSAAREGASQALSEHHPRLTRTRDEAAQMLGCSLAAVDRLLADGRLDRLLAGRITLASILTLAGWPLAGAPVSAPLSAVPDLPNTSSA